MSNLTSRDGLQFQLSKDSSVGDKFETWKCLASPLENKFHISAKNGYKRHYQVSNLSPTEELGIFFGDANLNVYFHTCQLDFFFFLLKRSSQNQQYQFLLKTKTPTKFPNCNPNII